MGSNNYRIKGLLKTNSDDEEVFNFNGIYTFGISDAERVHRVGREADG